MKQDKQSFPYGENREVFKCYGRREFIKSLCGGMILLMSSGGAQALEWQFPGYSGPSSPSLLAFNAKAKSNYPETIAILETLYREEIFTYLTYSVYAPKAISEGYPNIGYLFTAFKISEAIHARNFKDMLSSLEVEVKELPNEEIKVSSTKKNLKNATSMELRHIDQVYPRSISGMAPEKHEPTLWNAKNAWEGEKQHRDLIEKIKSGTGIFFGILARRIEKAKSHYLVCNVCGSTVMEIPEKSCTICREPVHNYKEIPRIEEGIQ